MFFHIVPNGMRQVFFAKFISRQKRVLINNKSDYTHNFLIKNIIKCIFKKVVILHVRFEC